MGKGNLRARLWREYCELQRAVGPDAAKRRHDCLRLLMHLTGTNDPDLALQKGRQAATKKGPKRGKPAGPREKEHWIGGNRPAAEVRGITTNNAGRGKRTR